MPISIKKILILILFQGAVIFAFSQESQDTFETSQRVSCDFVYNYSHTVGSTFRTELLYQNSVKKWLDLRGGLQFSTENAYAFLLRADFKYNVSSHHELQLRHQYLYNIHVAYNNQLFNTLFALAYSQKYCYVAFGAMLNLYAPLTSVYANGKLLEPHLLCYDIEARIFPEEHNWNLACQLTNLTPFMAERPQIPNFIVKYRHKVYDSAEFGALHVNAQLGLELAGFSHINAQFYKCYAKAGLLWDI